MTGCFPLFLQTPLLNWNIVDLQCCVNFGSPAKWFSYTCVCVCVCVYIYIYIYIYICGGLVNKSCPTLTTPWTRACQAPLLMGFSRQEYWSGLPFPSPIYIYISVQFSGLVVSNSLWPHELPHARPLSITNSRSSPKLMCIESVMPSSHLILCRPLLLLPPIPPSIRVFSSESTLCMRWPKYWSFSFSMSPSNQHPGLISFRMDWMDLLAVQGTLKSLFQHHSSKPSILQCSAFFTVQISHPYMTIAKTIALTRWTFVGKVISLLFNMLSRLVITFLPRSKCLLISWLQSPSAVILEPPKIKSDSFHCFSSVSYEVMGPDAMIFIFWMLSFKPTFLLSSFTFIRRLFSSSSLSVIRVVSSAYLRLLIFLPAILIPAVLLPAQHFS